MHQEYFLVLFLEGLVLVTGLLPARRTHSIVGSASGGDTTADAGN